MMCGSRMYSILPAVFFMTFCVSFMVLFGCGSAALKSSVVKKFLNRRRETYLDLFDRMFGI